LVAVTVCQQEEVLSLMIYSPQPQDVLGDWTMDIVSMTNNQFYFVPSPASNQFIWQLEKHCG
jgi:hypothetical protein